MKILFTDVKESWQKDFIIKSLPNDTIIVSEDELSLDLAKSNFEIEALSVFVTSKVTAEIMEQLPNLKIILTRSTGFDHVDTVMAKSKNIMVCSVPFYGENTVAEHAMALILALARKLPQTFARIEDCQFDYNGLRGWDLKGKTMGIIGGGHIGMHLAKMAKGFEMNILVYDLKPNEEFAKTIGFTYATTDALYTNSDVISLHLPFNAHTLHFINQPSIEKMKDGVYLINTARGGLVDSTALIEALQSGKIAGAGLDVLEGEDLINDEMGIISNPKYKDKWLTLLQDHILMEMENVIVTPHNAFNSNEALQRILQTTIDNVIAFEKNTPQNIVQV